MKQTSSQQRTTVSSEISVVKEEAYYLLHGEAQKGHINPSEEAPTLPDYKLMSLDLDFDPLRKFLNSVSTVVNQHASMINSLSSDVRTKITDIPVSEALNQIGNSTMLFDPDFNKQVALDCDKPRSEISGRPLEDNMNKLCNKMNMVGHALTWLFKQQMATDKAVTKIEGDMASKVEREEFKAKIKKTKVKIRKQIAENFTALDTKIVETDKKLLERIKALEKKVSEVEVSTIWRIKDCEDLLKSRVNDQFVLEACKTLEEKLMKEMLRVTEGNSSNLTSIYTELKVTVDRLIEDHNDKTKKTKGKLDDLEDMLNKKLAIIKFEEVKKVIFDRLDDLAKKLKDYTGKTDPALEKINATLKFLQDNAADLEKRFIGLNEKCDGMAGRVSNIPARADTPSPVGGVSVDAGRLGELEGLLRDLKREQQNTSILISSIQVEIKDKVDNMSYNLGLGKKMDKDEAMRLLEAGGSSEEKIKKLQRDVDDLVKKFEAMGDSVEKRIAKLRKELDINAIMKLIKSKVDSDQLKKELDTVEGKLASLADLLQTLKRDYENVHHSLKRMNQYFLIMQTGNNNDALLSTKACLSCGKGDVHFVPPVHTLKGSDGKVYAGKMTSSMGESLRAEYDLGIEVFGQREGQATAHMEGRHHLSGKFGDSIQTIKTLKPSTRVGSRDRPISAKMSKDNLKSTNLVATSIHLTAQNQNSTNLPQFRPTSAKQ